MKVWELDLSYGNKYIDNNNRCWYADGSDLSYIDADCNKFVVYIERFYDSLSEVFELTFEKIG